jgi:UDP-N-acetylenolpyruvoylglucosamine reductase
MTPGSLLEIAHPKEHSFLATLAGRLAAGTLIRGNEPMAKRTTLRVGGPADIYVEPVCELDLASILRFCAESRLKFFLLGRGSNLVVRDGGFRGVVICLTHPEFSRIAVEGETLICGAGARLKDVANAARRAGVGGFEFLAGIPGSVGGALHMNAGAMGGAIAELIAGVRVMDFGGTTRDLKSGEITFTYRTCATLQNHIALAARLRGRPDLGAAIEQRMSTFNEKRWSAQPSAPSAGCAFKNPDGMSAGKLIDELGLKGTRVGGAVVSAKHGNFIVNDGGATAGDVLQLIELVKERVRTLRAVELQMEVKIVGDEP